MENWYPRLLQTTEAQSKTWKVCVNFWNWDTEIFPPTKPQTKPQIQRNKWKNQTLNHRRKKKRLESLFYSGLCVVFREASLSKHALLSSEIIRCKVGNSMMQQNDAAPYTGVSSTELEKLTCTLEWVLIYPCLSYLFFFPKKEWAMCTLELDLPLHSSLTMCVGMYRL